MAWGTVCPLQWDPEVGGLGAARELAQSPRCLDAFRSARPREAAGRGLPARGCRWPTRRGRGPPGAGTRGVCEGQHRRSRPGAGLGVLRRGAMGALSQGSARPWGSSSLAVGRNGMFLVSPGAARPLTAGGWPRSCGRAPAAPWLVLTRSGDGGTGGSRGSPRSGGHSSARGTSPAGTLRLPGPSPGAGERLSLGGRAEGSCRRSGCFAGLNSAQHYYLSFF